MRYIFFMLMIWVAREGQGQALHPSQMPPTGRSLYTPVDQIVTSRPIQLQDMVNVEGSPYLTQDYVEGFVRLKNGQLYKPIRLRFDAMSNELQFLQGKFELALLDVDSAAYETVSDNGTKSLTMFKTGYPAVEDHTQTSFYQVLASGARMHLLKYYTCRLEQEKRMGEPDKKVFRKESSYFIYLPVTGQIKKVKLNKKEVLEAAGSISNAGKIAEELKINFKKEAEVTKLVETINTK